MNRYFSQIYIINLHDKIERYNKVYNQFKNRNIKTKRFIAVDGRCTNLKKPDILAKKKSFEITYDVKISNDYNLPLKELLPAASLTISTILLLREQVKRKYKHILICEDDINLVDGFEQKFLQGIKEINKSKYKDNWDILYLGCGRECGNKGISRKKSPQNKNFSDLAKIYGDEWYVENVDDLRFPCDHCENVSENISIPKDAAGSWCYAFSLSGAKKMLKLMDDDAGRHIDKYYQEYEDMGGMNILSFNPPIVYHEGGVCREGSSIPWKY